MWQLEGMPNICSNYVKITGNRATLDRLIAAQLGMSELVPPPSSMARGSEEWWAWIQENWSTKWISNHTRDGPPVIEDHGTYIESHFASAWFFPYAFYQGLVRQFPDLVSNYQYSCWETGFIGFGCMTRDTIDEQPTHCSYNTPEELNEGIRLLTEGRWQVWPGNPHFRCDELTGLYSYYEGEGAAEGDGVDEEDGETRIDSGEVSEESGSELGDSGEEVEPASRR
jgi:hypothetical protein